MWLDARQPHAARAHVRDEVRDAREVVDLDRRVAVALVREHAFEDLRLVERLAILRVEQHDEVRPEALAELGRRARDQRVPLIHDDDLVGKALRFEQQVRAQQHGLAARRHLVDQRQHRARRLRIEAGRRLIQ